MNLEDVFQYPELEFLSSLDFYFPFNLVFLIVFFQFFSF